MMATSRLKHYRAATSVKGGTEAVAFHATYFHQHAPIGFAIKTPKVPNPIKGKNKERFSWNGAR